MAEQATIIASAPGSLMLLGEHAVLHGHLALVCAINRRITVRLTPFEQDEIRIVSSLGDYECPLHNLMDHPALRFVIRAIQQHADQLSYGFELRIESEFPPDIGFGSSAAVTVATHAAVLFRLRGAPPEKEALFEQSLATVREVQGRGSGADVSASVFGGIVGYTTDPSFQPVAVSLPLTAVYSGYKTPTPEVIRTVEQRCAVAPAAYARIYAEMGSSAADALTCLGNHDLPGFGNILNHNQQLMHELGVNTPELQEIVEALQAAPDIFGAKISGSGMGDCAVGIGYADLQNVDYPVYHLEITPTGVECHD